MVQSIDNDIFGVLTVDKLDGINYSLWSFMVNNVLVPKVLWYYVSRDEVHPGNDAPITSPCGGGRGAIVVAGLTPPTLEKKRWNTKDAWAMVVIALTIKQPITPHIHSCNLCKTSHCA